MFVEVDGVDDEVVVAGVEAGATPIFGSSRSNVAVVVVVFFFLLTGAFF